MSDDLMTWLITGGMMGLLLVGYVLIKPSGKSVEDRAEELKRRKIGNYEKAEEASASLRKAGRGAQGAGNGPAQLISRLHDRIQRAGLPLSVKDYVILSGIFGCVMFILFNTIAGLSGPVAAMFALALSLWVPHLVVSFKIRKRVQHFLSSLPDAIELITRGLRSGLPIQESFQVVAEEIVPPVSEEFQKIAHAIAFGVPMEKALYDAAIRLRLVEFDFFVTSIILQRETGGNLAEILDNLASTIRNRHMMKMKIRALSAEARASSYILTALPFFFIGAIYLTTPGYLNILVDDIRGNIAALVAIGSTVTGFLVMKKMASFEI